MKKSIKVFLTVISIASLSLFLGACSPETGSKEWCEDMKSKNKADWTANEAADFAKNCLL